MRQGEIIFIAFVYFISASLSVGHLLEELYLPTNVYMSACNQFPGQRIVQVNGCPLSTELMNISSPNI